MTHLKLTDSETHSCQLKQKIAKQRVDKVLTKLTKEEREKTDDHESAARSAA